MQANGNRAVTNGYDGLGNLEGTTFGNGVTNLYQYDRLNRLTNATWNSGSTPLAGFYYQLGPTGNRIGLEETVNGTNQGHGDAC